MSSLGFTGVAAGNVSPSCFVKKTANDYEFDLAGANDPIFGITQDGTNKAPIPGVTSQYAAEAGESCRVHKPGERCLLKLGGTVSAGDRIKSDSSGNGVSIATSGTTPQRYGAVALQGGSSGELIEVEVLIGVESPA